jgi:hypothetical protein
MAGTCEQQLLQIFNQPTKNMWISFHHIFVQAGTKYKPQNSQQEERQ